MVETKIPVTGFLGAGTGITTTTLAAEFTSRASGQTGWAACGVKGLVKGVLGLLAFGISTRIPAGRAMASFFLEMFAYSSWGSWFLDVALAAYPGGIPGLAEDWAMTVRVYAAGGRRVARELGALERQLPIEEQRAVTPSSIL